MWGRCCSSSSSLLGIDGDDHGAQSLPRHHQGIPCTCMSDGVEVPRSWGRCWFSGADELTGTGRLASYARHVRASGGADVAHDGRTSPGQEHWAPSRAGKWCMPSSCYQALMSSPTAPGQAPAPIAEDVYLWRRKGNGRPWRHQLSGQGFWALSLHPAPRQKHWQSGPPPRQSAG